MYTDTQAKMMTKTITDVTWSGNLSPYVFSDDMYEHYKRYKQMIESAFDDDVLLPFNLVDLGCGTGEFALQHVQHHKYSKATLINVCPSQFAYINKIGSLGGRITTIDCDMTDSYWCENLPNSNRLWINAAFSLGNVTNLHAVAELCGDVLKDKDRSLLTIYDMCPNTVVHAGYDTDLDYNIRPTTDVIDVFESHGLLLLSCERLMQHEYKLANNLLAVPSADPKAQEAIRRLRMSYKPYIAIFTTKDGPSR